MCKLSKGLGKICKEQIDVNAEKKTTVCWQDLKGEFNSEFEVIKGFLPCNLSIEGTKKRGHSLIPFRK